MARRTTEPEKTSKPSKPRSGGSGISSILRRSRTIDRRSYGETEADRADIHALYETSVQSPVGDVEMISRVFAQRRGRAARTLREDFSGSAALSTAWVKSAPDRRATAIDLDAKVLSYAAEHHRAALSEEAAARLVLHHGDVRDRRIPGRFDAVASYNFSAFVFKERRALFDYFRAVRRALVKDGLFFFDVFGGTLAQEPSLEPRSYDGFSYIWEQASFDPLTSRLEAHIHFGFDDGSRIRRAFSYDWRLWQIVELRELLDEAGFTRSDVYWEDRDDEGEGTGRFRRRTKVDAVPGWTAYVVAER
ncbi:class I SAM-dependent methyltransferase [Myxococcota bacterium]|nr:class I SAM-dependent methyltransferase [Myxococcota bacterium]